MKSLNTFITETKITIDTVMDGKGYWEDLTNRALSFYFKKYPELKKSQHRLKIEISVNGLRKREGMDRAGFDPGTSSSRIILHPTIGTKPINFLDALFHELVHYKQISDNRLKYKRDKMGTIVGFELDNKDYKALHPKSNMSKDEIEKFVAKYQKLAHEKEAYKSGPELAKEFLRKNKVGTYARYKRK